MSITYQDHKGMEARRSAMLQRWNEPRTRRVRKI